MKALITAVDAGASALACWWAAVIATGWNAPDLLRTVSMPAIAYTLARIVGTILTYPGRPTHVVIMPPRHLGDVEVELRDGEVEVR